ncbi:MAG: hypothetical protein ACPL1F_05075 [bacterium]
MVFGISKDWKYFFWSQKSYIYGVVKFGSGKVFGLSKVVYGGVKFGSGKVFWVLKSSIYA